VLLLVGLKRNRYEVVRSTVMRQLISESKRTHGAAGECFGAVGWSARSDTGKLQPCVELRWRLEGLERDFNYLRSLETRKKLLLLKGLDFSFLFSFFL